MKLGGNVPGNKRFEAARYGQLFRTFSHSVETDSFPV
jgi:hypothetical protein